MPGQDYRITHGHANRSTEASYNRASGVVELTKQHPSGFLRLICNLYQLASPRVVVFMYSYHGNVSCIESFNAYLDYLYDCLDLFFAPAV